jgi:maltose/moltooligosaccharide transporter
VLALVAIYEFALVKELYVLAGGFIVFGLIHLIASALTKSGKQSTALATMVRDFNDMPGTMRQLAWVQFFSWFALFSMWIYTTSAVTSHLFKSSDTSSPAYIEGATFVGTLFSVYNGIAAIAALFIPFLSRTIGTRKTHLIALTFGGLGLISFYFVPSPEWLWLSMTGVGIAWASILSIPYALLSASLPPDKMGYYMGIFNFFIVIPQIIAAACLGVILKSVFDQQSIFVLVLGGSCMIVAGLLTLLVKIDSRVE